jgi:O-antigen ligase
MHVFRERPVDFVILWALSLLPLTFVFPFAPLKIGLYLVLLLSAVYLLGTQKAARRVYGEFKYTAAAFALFLPYTLLSIWLQEGMLKGTDNGVHFLYFLLISVCFWRLRSHQTFWCGLSAAAFGAGALAIYQRFGLGIPRPYGMYGINELALSGAIKFGMVTTVFSLLAMLAAFDKCTPVKLRLWHGVAALTGFAGCQAITSRGPWAALVVIGFCIVVGKTMDLERKRRRYAIIAALLGTLLLIAFFREPLHNRLMDTTSEFTTILSGNLNTSIGTRIAMWKAAWTMFLGNPLFGVGFNQFGIHLREMIGAGQAPDFIAVYGHAHNEYLEALATGGIVGLVYLLCLFGAPLVFFLRQFGRLRAAGADASAPMGGIITVLCFAVFSIGDNIFDRQMTTSLLAFLVFGFAVMSLEAPNPYNAGLFHKANDRHGA